MKIIEMKKAQFRSVESSTKKSIANFNEDENNPRIDTEIPSIPNFINAYSDDDLIQQLIEHQSLAEKKMEVSIKSGNIKP